jgi:hypothetical protein
MTRGNYWLTSTLLGLSVLGGMSRAAERGDAASESVFGQFVGSSPCGESIRQLLRIPADADSDLIQWKLTLRQDPKTKAPAGYKLHCDHGKTVPGTPGLSGARTAVRREGHWKISKGTKSATDAVVYELDGAVALVKVAHDILHVMNPDRSLMVGNGGWSYTLNRAESAEKPGDPDLPTPSLSYTISPAATGPTVFGIFEGRSPCLGIARELKLAEDAGGIKAKWRVTLYHNPVTLAPTTYKVEGSLHRKGAREGKWTIQRGNDADRNAIVYCLAPPSESAAPLYLLKGDDNVLFFLNQKRNPLVGHADFSYTLNRRSADAAAAKKPAK